MQVHGLGGDADLAQGPRTTTPATGTICTSLRPTTAAPPGTPSAANEVPAPATPSRPPCLPGAPVALRAELDGPVVHFAYDTGEGTVPLPLELDATVLFDEASDEFHDGQLRVLGVTGAMLGLWVQDLDGAGVHADFDHATYEEVTGWPRRWPSSTPSSTRVTPMSRTPTPCCWCTVGAAPATNGRRRPRSWPPQSTV
ncbi:hypothetical protein ABZX77_02815 [Streptomyces sp. NPDC004237]|uniref:beta-xylosidase family glycoside hydrolase n=1 Tax=Streptomyces sp. NPDC004237 TaxID=3154455 RepID=UPI0033B29989